MEKGEKKKGRGGGGAVCVLAGTREPPYKRKHQYTSRDNNSIIPISTHKHDAIQNARRELTY
jgi:hypothetical protein